ncbi:hypothetical protein DKM44_03885 [Deinococcus irradiatisoli]|uniref:Uncharacterized protein n=1 Tax=Deinococcus irradiatisoli TaxID=2202254 RepID=A0A2Z3JBG7_9DEIO|nr:hypothetical protein DKM44_03885 [Deinococcus irradiatisoli]
MLGYITAGATVLISAWTLFGKNKQDSFSRTEAERAHLDAENKSLRQRLEACDDTEHRLEVLKEFLSDILSDQYALDWIKTRAQTLKDRYKP